MSKKRLPTARPLLSAVAAGVLLAGAAAETAPKSKAIVIGFVGGVLKHDDRRHNEVLLAERPQRDFPAATVRVFENATRRAAHTLILKELGDDQAPPRIVLYGHSWGGPEAVALARQLESEGIPVLLTVQVDSLQKPGQNDGSIPGNVRETVNFYQTGGWLRGRRRIVPEDEGHTTILGNIRLAYKKRPAGCAVYPWYEMAAFARAHSEIECDPAVKLRSESAPR